MAKSVKKKTPPKNLEVFPKKSLHAEALSQTGGMKRAPWRLLLVGVLIVMVIAFLVYQNRKQFIVAVVNGQPIFRSQLNDELTKRYGERTLDTIISEKLVQDEMTKQNISINDSEVQTRLDELSKTLPQGVNLTDALAAQGVSEDQFRNQLKLQLAVDKLLSKDVSVSATEVDTYLKENKQALPATSEANLKQLAEDNIRRQKVEELFQGWFAGLKEKASVQRFL